MEATARDPSFTGLVVHHDPAFHFVLLVPDGWQRLDLLRSSSGGFCAPDPHDLLTGLAVEAIDLGTPVRPADLAALREAATIDAFAFWEPMFFEAMRTVHFGDSF